MRAAKHFAQQKKPHRALKEGTEDADIYFCKNRSTEQRRGFLRFLICHLLLIHFLSSIIALYFLYPYHLTSFLTPTVPSMNCSAASFKHEPAFSSYFFLETNNRTPLLMKSWCNKFFFLDISSIC